MFAITGYQRSRGLDHYTIRGLKKRQADVWFKLIKGSDEGSAFDMKCFALNIE